MKYQWRHLQLDIWIFPPSGQEGKSLRRCRSSQNCSRVLPLECARNALSNSQRNGSWVLIQCQRELLGNPIDRSTRQGTPTATMRLKGHWGKHEPLGLAGSGSTLKAALEGSENNDRLLSSPRLKFLEAVMKPTVVSTEHTESQYQNT